MLVPAVLAALAALPVISAQSTSTTSSIATDCTTLYTIFPVPTGTAGVPTYYSFQTTTNFAAVTYTTRDTVTVTPEATTFTDVVTATTVVTTTTTSTPDAIVQPTPVGFIPLRAVNPAPTAVSRIKRLELSSPLKRQTPDGYSAGFIAYPNGTYSGLMKRNPYRVDCGVTVSVLETTITIEVGEPVTSVAPQSVATAVSTSTVEETTTVTEVAATPTVYAACGVNNVVNSIPDVNGKALIFNQVIYRPAQGFPLANELVINTTDAVTCCVRCQETEHCAGSFYAPGAQECHLRLTEPYVPSVPIYFLGGTAAPSATATGGLIIPTATPDNSTCSEGSLSSYLGVIRGSESFPVEFSLVLSNGPCGRFSVDPVPLELGGTVAPLPGKRGIAAF